MTGGSMDVFKSEIAQIGDVLALKGIRLRSRYAIGRHAKTFTDVGVDGVGGVLGPPVHPAGT